MSVFLQPIYTQTVGSGGAASITFNNIPQTFTDLSIVISGRSARSGQQADNLFVTFNGVTTNYSATGLQANGSSVSTSRYTSRYASLAVNAAGSTANTFSSHNIYIPNYTSSSLKSFLVNSVSENNATNAQSDLFAGLWSNTAAITSISLLPEVSTWVQNTTISIYGITRG